MSTMSTYTLASAVSGEASIAGYGLVAYEYEAGTITPADEKHAATLAYLASVGIATITTEVRRSKSAKDTSASAEVEAPKTKE